MFCHVLSLPSARLGACDLTHSRLIGRVRESDLPQPHVCTPALAKVSRSAPRESRIRPLCVSPVFASAWFFAGEKRHHFGASGGESEPRAGVELEFPRFREHLSAWAVRPGEEGGVHIQDPLSPSLPGAVSA